MKKEIYFVTSNDGKFEEVKTYIENYVSEITVKQFKAKIPEIQTLDQKEVAMDKALKAWEILKKPLIIDDAAIYFEKYNNFPGIMSKYVSLGLGFEGIKKIIDNGDKAKFLLYLTYIENPTSIKIFEGKCHGTLNKPEKFCGNPNLPYDCFFTPEGSNKTYEELRHTQEGNNFLYRIKALKAFIEWYGSKN